jgi:CubicO group peptidase (beta-lactamase class C family)
MRRPDPRFVPWIALVVLALAFPVAAQEAPSAAGIWTGSIEVPGSPLGVQVELVPPAGPAGWSGTLDIPAQGAADLPLEEIAVDGAAVSFRIAGVPGAPTFRGTVSEDGGEMAGELTQGGATLPFHLRRGEEAPAEGPALPDPESALADLPEVVERGLEALRVPGMAVAVVASGEVVFSRGFGFRNLESKLPVTPETVFAIGSSTKAMTATVVGTLVDDGLLRWDEPVRTYLPDFRLADASATERLTVGDLLTHRSGLPRHDLAWYGSPRSREELFESLRHLELSADLRERFQYQNLMYMTAGYLAGQETGSTWEDLVRERVLEPLGMTHTVLSRFDGLPDVATGYQLDRDDDGEVVVRSMPYRVIEAMGPAGSVNSTAEDMARWVRFQLGDGTVDGTQVVSKATLDEMHSPQIVASLPLLGLIDPKMSPYILYGMGWFIQPYRGHHLIHHGGNIDGFSAMVAFLPQEDLGVVVLSNGNGSPLPLAVALSVFDRLLGLEPVDWVGRSELFLKQALAAEAEQEGAAAADRVEGTEPSHPLDAYVGEFDNPGYGMLRVTRDGDALAFALNGLEGALEHWHYDVFNAPETPVGAVKIEFLTAIDGRIDRVQAAVEPAVAPIVFARKPPVRLSDPAFLERLAGDYVLSGQPVTVAVRGDRLTVSLPGQPTYTLVPYDGTEYRLEKLPGYRVRFELEGDRVTGLTFLQPNGVFRATRRDEAPAQ